jgi:general L-amino acid transport system substrate-binding protein
MRVLAAVAAALWVLLPAAGALAGPTLDGVLQRGVLRCGVNTGLAGFAQQDSQGGWSGLDIDICKAVAAAILGSPDKVAYVPLSAQQRFTALQSGEIDLLSRNTTWTLSRDAGQGMNFAPVVYYDGQGFLVEKVAGVASAKELDGAAICVQQGTTTERNLADWFRANKLTFTAVVGETMDQINADFFSGRCDVLTTDASGLAAVRASVAHNPDDYVILPELISKEPLAPAVRHGDDQFFDIVKWVVYALIEAEEKGITSANLDAMTRNADPAIRRLLGVQPELGAALGLNEKWAYNVIRAVGNYGEIYDRHLGPATPFKLQRGLNALWTNGGLMYAMPLR